MQHRDDNWVVLETSHWNHTKHGHGMIPNTGLSNKCLTILDFEMYDVGKDHNRSLFIVLVWLIETSSNCILQVYTIYHWSFLKIVVSNLQDLSVDCWWMNIGRNITVSSQRIYVVLFAESDGVCMNHSQNLLSTIVASPHSSGHHSDTKVDFVANKDLPRHDDPSK